MNTKQFSPEFKEELQKDLLKAYKNGTRILDMLVEYQRLYQLEGDDVKRLLTKKLKEKMFEQEKEYKTVITRKTKHLKIKPSKKKISDLELDD